MLNEKRLKQVVRKMNDIAEPYECEVTLDKVDLEEESFVVQVAKNGVSSKHRFTCLEDNMVKIGKLEMTANPRLMFGAIYI